MYSELSLHKWEWAYADPHSLSCLPLSPKSPKFACEEWWGLGGFNQKIPQITLNQSEVHTGKHNPEILCVTNIMTIGHDLWVFYL
jgi:hypothetical protein